MRKNNLNFVVDALAFVAFVSLATTGVLMRYILPPGSGHFSALWGMDRHGWGQIHFWLSTAFMAALGLHLLLHWRWITAVVGGRPRQGSGVRIALACVGLISLAGLALAPFFAQVERTTRARHRPDPIAQDKDSAYEIDGSVSLSDIERLSGVSPHLIAQELGLPPTVDANAHLGELRQRHGFKISQVRAIVQQHANKQ